MTEIFILLEKFESFFKVIDDDDMINFICEQIPKAKNTFSPKFQREFFTSTIRLLHEIPNIFLSPVGLEFLVTFGVYNPK